MLCLKSFETKKILKITGGQQLVFGPPVFFVIALIKCIGEG